MARKLKNWLKAFDEWVVPRSEAPLSMIHWSGIFTLSSIMKRKILIPEKLMGGYCIYPSLYIVFVAKPGVARKSTTISNAEKLLELVGAQVNGEHVNFAADVTSYSKFTDAMAGADDGSMTIIANEFANIVRATPEAMYETLTELFDNRSKFRSDTWSHGDGVILDPVVNLIAATTPTWIAEQPAGYFVGGGFASRILFIIEKKRRTNQLYYDHLDFSWFDKRRADLQHDLHHISQLKGEFSHDSKDTHDYIEKWYQEQAKKEEVVGATMEGFAQRRHIHTHKVAMLLSIAESDDLKITTPMWKEAVRLLDNVEQKLPRSLTSAGSNPMGHQMQNVLDFIEEKEKVSLKILAARFRSDVPTLEQLQSILSYLVISQEIEAKGQGINITYTLK